MAKVAILDLGRWDFLHGPESTSSIAGKISDKLLRDKIDAVILKKLPDSESAKGYSALIFLTRGMLAYAEALKKNNPGQTVIVYSGVIEKEDCSSDICFVQKGNLEALEKISTLVR